MVVMSAGFECFKEKATAPTATVIQNRMGGALPIKGAMWGMAVMPRKIAWPNAVPAKKVGKMNPPLKPVKRQPNCEPAPDQAS